MNRRWAACFVAFCLLLGGCAALPTTSTNLPAPDVGQPAQRPEQSQQADPTGPSAPNPGTSKRPAPAPKREHVDIHGLYMTGWTAGSDRFYELVDYMTESGLNAVVIDVMDDDGYISWETKIPLAVEIGAHELKIADIEERLKYLKERQIYTIGRIVVYADPLLGRSRPDMAILGGEFVDTRGIRWPDP
ncbi:MAG TPA: putative glycoside hydrolase, partial [Symbiobacteriaceae bacterium]|nr:putative glycoside hydrolase [Symbiobacteriaceae bacterium]